MAPAPEDVYCTLLLSDAYLPGAQVIAHSLRDTGTKYRIAVMVTLAGVTENTVNELKKTFDYVIPVEPIYSTSAANLSLMRRLDLHAAMTKINLWNQTQFRRIVYVDADMVALRAPDELFDTGAAFAAAPDVGWPDCFNSGLMVVKPDQKIYEELISLASQGRSFDGADQGLLNQYFGDWHRLSFVYNCTIAPTMGYQYAPAFKHYGSNVSMVHFIGAAKPWDRGQSTNTGSGDPYEKLSGHWWSVFNKHEGVSSKQAAKGGSEQTYSRPTGTQNAWFEQRGDEIEQFHTFTYEPETRHEAHHETRHETYHEPRHEVHHQTHDQARHEHDHHEHDHHELDHHEHDHHEHDHHEHDHHEHDHHEHDHHEHDHHEHEHDHHEAREIEAEVQAESRPEVDAEVHTETRPEVRTEERPELRPEVRREVRPEARQERRPRVQTEPEPEFEAEYPPEIRAENLVQPEGYDSDSESEQGDNEPKFVPIRSIDKPSRYLENFTHHHYERFKSQGSLGDFVITKHGRVAQDEYFQTGANTYTIKKHARPPTHDTTAGPGQPFHAPQSHWDPTKSAPPQDGAPEANKLTIQPYPNAWDSRVSTSPFVATTFAPPPRHHLWYDIPEATKPQEAPKTVFPWEEKPRHRVTRVFMDDPQSIHDDPSEGSQKEWTPPAPEWSAPEPQHAAAAAEPPLKPLFPWEQKPRTVTRVFADDESTSSNHDSSEHDDDTASVVSTEGNEWRRFVSRENRWDTDPAIRDYVLGLRKRQHQAIGEAPSFLIARGEVPPITPAPLRRAAPTQAKAEQHEAPEEPEWDPEKKLEELRRLPPSLLSRLISTMQATEPREDEDRGRTKSVTPKASMRFGETTELSFDDTDALKTPRARSIDSALGGSACSTIEDN